MEGGDWNWVTQAKLVEFRTSVPPRRAVDLIDDQQDRNPLAPENVGDLMIKR